MLDDKVQETIHEFESNWGETTWTVNVNMWDDRSFQIEVYHTKSRKQLAGRTLVRRLSTLRDVDGSFEHREYMVLPRSIVSKYEH